MYAQTNRRKGRRGLLTPRIDDEACYVVNKTCSSHERHSRGLHPEHAFLEITYRNLKLDDAAYTNGQVIV